MNLIKKSTPPIVKPALKLPVNVHDIIKVDIEATILHVIALYKCLFLLIFLVIKFFQIFFQFY